MNYLASWLERRPPQPFCDLWRFVPGGREARGFHKALRFLGTAIAHYGWQACFLLRISQWFIWVYLYPASFALHRILIHLFGVDIHPSVAVGSGLWMPHAMSIVVHRGSVIGRNVTIFHQVTLGGRKYKGYPKIGDGVNLYCGCSVLGGIEVGEEAMVGAHALVLSNVPARAIVAGIPAKVIGVRE